MIKCLMCNDKYKDRVDLFKHYEKEHRSEFDDSWSGAKAHFFKNYGRITGKCKECKKDTTWNDLTDKPHVFCDDPKCRKEFRARFVKRMINKHGKSHLLDDPEVQKKMLSNRSISGNYEWSNGSHVQYVGSYERDFLQFLDKFMNMDSNDVMSPAPQIVDYIDRDGTKRFYIPDLYIPSLNLVVEIKDGGDNPNTHHKIVAVDKEKEKLKDNAIRKLGVNYVKVVDKKYFNFLNYINELKNKSLYKDEESIILEGFSSYDNGRGLENVYTTSNSHSIVSEGYSKYIPDANNNNISVYVFKKVDSDYLSWNESCFLYTNDGHMYRLLIRGEFETAKPSEYDKINGEAYLMTLSIPINTFKDVLFEISTRSNNNDEFVLKVFERIADKKCIKSHVSEIFNICEPVSNMSSYDLESLMILPINGEKDDITPPDYMEKRIIESINDFILSNTNISPSLLLSEGEMTERHRDYMRHKKATMNNINRSAVPELNISFKRNPRTSRYYDLITNAYKKNTLTLIEDKLVREDSLMIPNEMKIELLSYIKVKYDNMDDGYVNALNTTVLPVSIINELGYASVINLNKEYSDTMVKFNTFITFNSAGLFNNTTISTKNIPVDFREYIANLNTGANIIRNKESKPCNLDTITSDILSEVNRMYHGVII